MDEIGEMSPPLQAKLLQVLQDGEFSRLGGKHDVRVDVRVIAATNRVLEEAVLAGQFREDLFFRLNVVSIHVPPLRERREEIPALSEYFVKKYSVQFNKPHAELSEETMRVFVDYHWPGNVRELENVIKRIVVLGNEAPIRRDLAHRIATPGLRPAASPSGASPVRTSSARSAPAVVVSPPPAPPLARVAAEPVRCSLKDVSRIAAREAERELIWKMLQQTRWNRKETAGRLGISYKALLYKIKENGLDEAS
jgi:transcriptional regulator with PAS, ATPase and Fis domain